MRDDDSQLVAWARMHRLTTSVREVLALACEGFSLGMIAELRRVERGTVFKQASHIRKKTSQATIHGAALAFLRHALAEVHAAIAALESFHADAETAAAAAAATRAPDPNVGPAAVRSFNPYSPPHVRRGT